MNKTDGEYELVLGNRQLLSAFFIIVILFGVFFTMGYVVGRNSAPPASAASLPPSTTATNLRPEAASPAAPPPASPQAASPQREIQEPPVAAPKTVAPVEKPPVKEPPRETASRPAPPPPRQSAASADTSVVPAVTPGPGRIYLQVVAVAQPQAGVVVDTLKQKG